MAPGPEQPSLASLLAKSSAKPAKSSAIEQTAGTAPGKAMYDDSPVVLESGVKRRVKKSKQSAQWDAEREKSRLSQKKRLAKKEPEPLKTLAARAFIPPPPIDTKSFDFSVLDEDYYGLEEDARYEVLFDAIQRRDGTNQAGDLERLEEAWIEGQRELPIDDSNKYADLDYNPAAEEEARDAIVRAAQDAWHEKAEKSKGKGHVVVLSEDEEDEVVDTTKLGGADFGDEEDDFKTATFVTTAKRPTSSPNESSSALQSVSASKAASFATPVNTAAVTTRPAKQVASKPVLQLSKAVNIPASSPAFRAPSSPSPPSKLAAKKRQSKDKPAPRKVRRVKDANDVSKARLAAANTKERDAGQPPEKDTPGEKTDEPVVKKKKPKPKNHDYDSEIQKVLTDAQSDLKAFAAAVNCYAITTTLKVWAKEAWFRANERINPDEIPYQFTEGILKTMGYRLPSFRCAIRTAILPYFAGHYGFRLGGCEEHVAHNVELYEGLKAKSTFTCKEYTIKSDVNANVPNATGRYENEFIFKSFALAFFRNREDLGPKFPNYFNPVTLECIAFIVALIEHCLDEWSTGEEVKQSLNQTLNGARYALHLENLEMFQDRNPRRCAKLRQDLYQYGRKYAKLDRKAKAHRVDGLSGDDFEEDLESEGGEVQQVAGEGDSSDSDSDSSKDEEEEEEDEEKDDSETEGGAGGAEGASA